jgi:CBS domain containing-hemolysin-like protein
LLVASFCIAANGFFVAAEMGLARVRRTRMDQLSEEGSKAALLVQKELDDPDRFISACQLGITLATLGLGFVGETTFANDLALWLQTTELGAHLPLDMVNLSRIIVFVVVFILVAYLQTVLGELLPKTITFQRAEIVALRLAPAMNLWCTLATPFIYILNGSTDFILRALHIEEPPRRHFVHTEEELKMLVSASHEEGVLEPEEEEMLHSVFDFSDTVASEVMTPRTDMICVPATDTVRQFVELALEHGHSRIPMFEQDLDNIFGLVHIRDGLRALIDKKDQSPVREFARKVLIVPENKNAGDLLAEFKKTKTHMAIVVDEYGGTRGMVTLEDLLEELVGDIADEHEIVEEYVQECADGSFLLDAKMPLDEADELLGLGIGDEEFNTLGGHVFGQLGREPQPGDEVVTPEYTLRVEESDRHRIIKLRLIKHKPGEVVENDGNGKHRVDATGAKETPRSVEAG